MADAMDKNAGFLIPVTVDEVMAYASENRTALMQGAVGGAGSFHEWLEASGRGKFGYGQGAALLKGLDLRHADLSLADFSGIYCDGTTFEGAIVDGAAFEAAHMPYTCFKDILARDVSFAGAMLEGANFSGARLIGSGPLSNGHIRKNVDFTAADAFGASFGNAICRNVLFTHALLAEAHFTHTELENVRFNGANMIGVDFEGAQPKFRQQRGVHNHPVGIETSGSIIIGEKNASAFDGRLEDAIRTPRQMADALSRAIAVCRAGFPSYPHARRQVDIRQGAASMLAERFPEKSEQSGITSALNQLREFEQPEKPFATKVAAARNRSAANSRHIPG